MEANSLCLWYSLLFKCRTTRILSPGVARLSLSLNCSMHLTAASGSSKLTKPCPLDLPFASRCTTAEVILPQLANAAASCSSVTSSLMFLTITLVNNPDACPFSAGT
jgi:hypothetical protein